MSDTLTPERIAELRAMLAKMTPAPWHDDGYRVYGPTNDTDKRSGRVLFEHKHADYPNHSDYPAIVELRNLAAYLLDAAEERATLRSLLTRVKRVLPPGELYEAILSVLHEEETS